MMQFWKCLDSLNYDVTHFCISTEKHPFDINAYPTKIREKSTISSVKINTKPSFFGALLNLIKGKSYLTSRFDQQEVRDRIIRILREKEFDIIILESLYTCAYIDDIRKYTLAKIAIRTHNIEFRIWEDLAKNSGNIIRSIYLKKMAAQLKQYELKTLEKSDVILSISDEDKENLNQLGINKSIQTIPVAMDDSTFEFEPAKNRICFIGAMNWEPNVEAVDELTGQIYPELRRNNPELELHLSGSYMNHYEIKSELTGIINHGFVENPLQFLSQNGVFIVPIKSGSGVRIKILEALSVGAPIITTRAGAEGIKTDKALIICKDSNEVIKMADSLLKDVSQQMELSNAAKSFIHENYSIISVVQKLKVALEN